MNAKPLDTVHEHLALLRLSRVIGVTRAGPKARVQVRPPDDGPELTLVLEGCSALELVPMGDARWSPIEDVAVLSRLDLQVLDLLLVPEPSVRALAWAVGAEVDGTPVRGGLLRVRADDVWITDGDGRRVTRRELVARADASTRARSSSNVAATHRQALDQARKTRLLPCLRAAGFVADKLAFFRLRQGLVDVVLIEVGRFASGESLQFTVAYRVLVGDAGGAKPSARSVVMNTRTAYLRELEPYYLLAGTIDIDALGARLEDDARRFILPYFDRFADPSAVVASLLAEDRARGDHQNAERAAEILVRLGRLGEAKQCFLDAPGDRDLMRRVAGGYGIDLDR